MGSGGYAGGSGYGAFEACDDGNTVPGGEAGASHGGTGYMQLGLQLVCA